MPRKGFTSGAEELFRPCGPLQQVKQARLRSLKHIQRRLVVGVGECRGNSDLLAAEVFLSAGEGQVVDEFAHLFSREVAHELFISVVAIEHLEAGRVEHDHHVEEVVRAQGVVKMSDDPAVQTAVDGAGEQVPISVGLHHIVACAERVGECILFHT